MSGRHVAWFAPPQVVVAEPAGHGAHTPAHARAPAAQAVATHRFWASQLVAVALAGHWVQTPLQTREPAVQVEATHADPLHVVAVTLTVGQSEHAEPHWRYCASHTHWPD